MQNGHIFQPIIWFDNNNNNTLFVLSFYKIIHIVRYMQHF